MSSRLGIASQVVAVAALAAVVYLAFLKPGDPDPLSEIQIEDGAQVEMTPMRNRPGERRSPAARPAPQRAHPRVSRAGVAGTAWSSTDGQTPAGAQYSSGVARILEQVARAHN